MLDFQLRQDVGQVFGVDETLVEGHANTRREVEAANLPAAESARIPQAS